MRKNHYYIIALLFLFTDISLPQSVFSSNIAVITRKNIIPYETFLNGFNNSFKKSKISQEKIKEFYFEPNLNIDDLNEKIVSFKPDLIITVGSGALKYALKQLPDIPIIYSMIINPETIEGIHQKHVSGVSMLASIDDKFVMLKKIIPNVKSVGAVYNPSECGKEVRAAITSAKKVGLELKAVPVPSSKETITAMDNVMASVDAYLLFFDRKVLNQQTFSHLLSLSFRKKIPIIGLSEKYVNLGALFSLDVEINDISSTVLRCAELIINEGRECSINKTKSLPWELTVNKKIADKMGIIIPDYILQRAKFIKE